MIKNSDLIQKNKELFNHQSKNEKIILVEYNNFHGSHLCQALLGNFFKKKNSSKIVAYFNYSLIVSPLKTSSFQKLKWKLSTSLLLGFKKIYKSFGVEAFLRPEITKNITNKAKKISNKFFKNSIKNRDIVNFKVGKIWIGDLIYDTYLKSRLVPTINPKTKDFRNFLKEFLELFLYWEEYFKSNKVSHLIGVHSCYSYGIPIRIAINNNIPSYIIHTRAVIKIDKKMQTMNGESKFFKKDFSKINTRFQKKTLEIAKTNLNKRIIKGKSGFKVGLVNRSKSSFPKVGKRKKSILNRNSKIKILICTHDFTDSVHVNGKNFFSDFYLWICYLGKLSNEKHDKYEFYIKNHPYFGNKYERYQKYTDKVVNQLIKKFPNIKKIPNNTSHHQIISEGIDFVLTVYGSVAIEYAYLGIPVINASKNNPHINYNFNINPKNLSEYKKVLNNLKKIKLKIKKNEIYECYFMKHFYYDENWLFDDYQGFLKKIGGYHNIHTVKFYDYWEKNLNKNLRDKVYRHFDKFISSKHKRLSIFDTEKEKEILKYK